MAVTSELKSKKIKIQCSENSQTVTQVLPTATDEQCYKGGVAFAGLMNERYQKIVLITEKTLKNE